MRQEIQSPDLQACHMSRAKIYLFLENIKLFSASYYQKNILFSHRKSTYWWFSTSLNSSERASLTALFKIHVQIIKND